MIFVFLCLHLTIDNHTTMFQELEDSFNYGLFQPPLNGRAGKFLDEERRLSEYPFQGNVGHLEVSTPSHPSVSPLLHTWLPGIKGKIGQRKFVAKPENWTGFQCPPGKEGP